LTAIVLVVELIHLSVSLVLNVQMNSI